jgi:2-polyprenyl-3-methyl-5-hydroxy-6-metoxy-1,4-benzoquinol methylase
MIDQYDFIVCCEVIEHFYHPSQEFQNLFQTLRAKGKLICKTHLFEEGIDFDTWYYKNDPSHVFIYQAETMLWIKNNYLLKDVKINKRVITFTK